jgi:acetyltransferase
LNLDELSRINKMFYPERITVIGATDSPDRVGYNLLESVVFGGFNGEVYPVHPRLETLLGLKVYPSVEELPATPDLAIVSLNQHGTVEALEQCGKMGVQGAVCVSGGFKETDEAGRQLEEQLKAVAAKYNIKVVGPNTLGFINTRAGLSATFYPMRLPTGNISFISQSGGMGLSIIGKCMDEGIGINKWIGAGNRSVLEIADYIEYLCADESTDVIGVFLEGVEDARRLALTAGEVLRKKPVVIFKVGESDEVGYATITHTGSLASPHRLYMDIFAQHGMLTVSGVPELVAACKALSLCSLPKGKRVGMFTYSAGPSIVALDKLAQSGITVPPLAGSTIDRIKKIIGDNPPVVLKNPLDAVGLGFLPEIYGRLAEAVMDDPGMDLLATFSCYHKNWRNPSSELIAAGKKIQKPILACYISAIDDIREDRKLLQAAGIPLYTSPDESAWGISALLHYTNLSGGEAHDGA